MTLSAEDLLEKVRKVNYCKSKAQNIHKLASLLEKERNGMVPKDFRSLLALPGVGPKIAVLLQTVVFGDVEAGIVVDSNLQRVAWRCGWTKKNEAEGTRLELQKSLPPADWEAFSLDAIAFGQVICQPRNPACSICPLKDTCPKVQLPPVTKRGRAAKCPGTVGGA